MKTLILAVDDDPELLYALEMMLKVSGFAVVTAVNGEQALQQLEQYPDIQVIVADVAMPNMNGYQLFTHVSQNPQWAHIPFIFLTARSLNSDIRFGKELGADDYLIKPVDSADLIASIRGKLKRAKRWSSQTLESTAPPPEPNDSDDIKLGTLRISLSQHRVWLSNKPIKLSAREFTLLAHLAQQLDHVVPAQTLVGLTHNLDTDAKDAGSLIRPLIRSLRRKLGYPPGDMGCIENVRGVGYRLIPPTG
ncbi:MAG: DNA-binding response regulator [Chloroflexi bacterium]|nr:MAG: DNA-binding response regulator [Chloroflexota bacterium]